ncbi:MAG: hypothetical protein M3461_04090 [Pseudomonadota bacterium]|nr:hypothetical protein [Pseudomonadota bacterium]
MAASEGVTPASRFARAPSQTFRKPGSHGAREVPGPPVRLRALANGRGRAGDRYDCRPERRGGDLQSLATALSTEIAGVITPRTRLRSGAQEVPDRIRARYQTAFEA